jgi:hypothetical protein
LFKTDAPFKIYDHRRDPREAVTPLDCVSHPYSHPLAMLVMWALGAVVIALIARADRHRTPEPFPDRLERHVCNEKPSQEDENALL